MQIRTLSLIASDKVAQTLRKVGIHRIPGTKAFYHLLNELLWLIPARSIMEIEGSKMYLNPHVKGPMRVAFRSYIWASGKEKLTTHIFKHAVKDGHTVVDVGANVGYFTLLAARLVGKQGKVYSFEPEPNNYEVLTKNIALNRYDNVIPTQKAVSNRAGKVKLYLSGTDVGAHTLREQHDHMEFSKKQQGEFTEVESITLDEFLNGKIHSINVIKMDCEGSEMAVLLGMENIIRENKDLKMFIEFFPSAIREMGYSPEEFIQKLQKYGFSITAIDELRSSTNQAIKINSVDELMSLCTEKGKIINLFLER